MSELAIIGATFYGNRGAEAMLSATIGALRERLGPKVRFNVFSYYPVQDQGLVCDPMVQIHPATPLRLVSSLLLGAIAHRLCTVFRLPFLIRVLPSSVQALARSRALVCLAGVSFIDERLKFLPFNVATLLPALVLGVPVIKASQAMGPFKRALNRHAARIVLGACARVFARGERTAKNLDEILPRGRWERADDVAFLFRPEFALSKRCEASLEPQWERLQKARQERRTIVGICPSSVVEQKFRAAGRDYAGLVVETIAELTKAGCAIALFPNATRADEMDRRHNNDLPLMEEIGSRLPGEARDHVAAFLGPLNVADIYEVIGACDVVAVSRFHAMIAALSLCIPVAVLGWSHKYAEVMRLFEQEEMVLDYAEGTPSVIVAAIIRLVSERPARVAKIAEHLPAVRGRAVGQIDYISSLVARSDER